MCYARLVVTAYDEHWLGAAIDEFTGYSASVIACDCEAGQEQRIFSEMTPDGRVGASVLVFAFSHDALAKAVQNRVGQCLMTCATTAVFDGLPGSETHFPLGKQIRYFGDGYQKSKLINGRRYWRIPVMDGEFLVEERMGAAKGIAGGNIIVQAESQVAALDATRRAVDAIADMADVITPFPGGVARSGSKVGSRYKALKASTSDGFCPSLRGRVETRLADNVNCALEIVIDGCTDEAIRQAMSTAIRFAAGDGVVAISAGNYGGKLGKHHFSLRELI